MANNEEKMTGYPHLDRPWMKYYDDEKAKMPLPQKTIYQNMVDNVSNYRNNVAITFNGKQILYDQFVENVDISAKILSAVGVEDETRVLYLMANLPEAAYTLFGNNLLGAVSDYADPRPDSVDFKISAQKMLNTIKKEKITKIVALDQCYLAMIKPIENEIKELGINPIVIVSPSDTMTAKEGLYYFEEYVKFNGFDAAIKKMKQQKIINEKVKEAIATSVVDIVKYSDMEKNVSSIVLPKAIFTPHKMAAITHSSGTSGTLPKAIPLTNEGIISYGYQLTRSNVDTKIGDSSLQILPYFAAYGLGIANFGFSNADNMIQVPEFSPNNLGKLIKKYKPNVLIGTPNWYLSMPNDKSIAKADLSFINTIGYGGESMAMDDEIKINDFLLKHDCPVKLTKGHGMSELSGGSSYAIGEYNIPGSMGIPMIDTIYGVVDPETHKALKFEDGMETLTGELIVSSPAMVDAKLDEHDVVEHGTYDGMDFIYTKDIGTIDKNGVLYFLTRSDRGFTRFDGFKVKPYQIEDEIKKVEGVKECIITSYDDEKKFGKMIKADIVLIDDSWLSKCDEQTAIEYILDKAFVKNPNVSTRQIPTKFRIREQLPVTKNFKIDYNAIQNEGLTGDEYDVIFDETSISVGEMRVQKSNAKQKIKQK